MGREGGLKIWRKFESMDRGEHRYRGVERKCTGRGMYVYGRRRRGRAVGRLRSNERKYN